jgi:hypothetical protein
MDSQTGIGFIPYFIGFVACAMLIKYIYEKKRTEALMQIAKQMSFSFSTVGKALTEQKHQRFQLFSKGHSKKIKNEMSGSRNGMDVSVFGYQYTVGHGKNSNTYTQTVVSMTCSSLNLPIFELKPENTFHKIGQVFGYQDIDFEAFPNFSKNYLLRGSSESKIRQLFTPNIIRFFEKNKNTFIEAEKDTLIFYQSSKRCKPEEIAQFVDEGQRIQALFINQ